MSMLTPEGVNRNIILFYMLHNNMTVTDIILSLHYITVVIVTCDTILILNSNPKFLIKKIK